MKNFHQKTKKNFYILSSILVVVAAIAFFHKIPTINQESQDAQKSSDGLLQTSELLSDNPLMFLLTDELWSSGSADVEMSKDK